MNAAIVDRVLARPRNLRSIGDGAFVLLAPLLVAVVTGSEPMTTGLQTSWTMIDPNFYTAYAQHGPELMQRFGPVDYFWVRLGFILPAKISFDMFGAVPGFIGLRYVFALVASVPSWLLFRRWGGRGAGALVVVSILCCPVVVNAWGTDYPDSAAVSYLTGGVAALVMPAQGRGRVSWRCGAGALFMAAACSHSVAVVVVAGAVVGIVVAGLVRGTARVLLCDLAAVAAGAAVVFVIMVGASVVLYGQWDIVGPTIAQYHVLQTPGQIAMWHSTTWSWAQRATYLLVPPVLAAGWFAAHARAAVTRPEFGLVVGLAVQCALFAYLQADDGATLEYYFYSSMLWSSVPLAGAALLTTLSGDVPARPRPARYLPAAVVLAVAVATTWLPTWRFAAWPTGVVLATTLVGVIAWGARSHASPVRAATMVLTIVVTTCLTIGQPKIASAPGEIGYPLPDYAKVLGNDAGQARDVYRVLSALPPIVQAAVPPRASVALWFRDGQSAGGWVTSRAAAQYLWKRNALKGALPDLKQDDLSRLASSGTRHLVLLDPAGDVLNTALRALDVFQPRVLIRCELHSGEVVLHVAVVELDAAALTSREVNDGHGGSAGEE